MLRDTVLVVAVVVTAGSLVTAVPSDLSHLADAVNDLKSVCQDEEKVQQDMANSIQGLSQTMTNLQHYLVGSNELDASTAVESIDGEREDGIRFFTRHVIQAINSGNNTQLNEILNELKQLNTAFREHFRKEEVCPHPFIALGDECFNFQLEDLSWEESRQRCRRLGAELAEPKNLTMVRLYIAEHFPRKDRRNFWIGGVNNNKVWEWLSGNPVPSGFWYTNEPSGNGECLAMFDGWEHPLTDFPCENGRRAVCERRVV